MGFYTVAMVLGALYSIANELGNVSATTQNRVLTKQISQLQKELNAKSISSQEAMTKAQNLIDQITPAVGQVDSRLAGKLEGQLNRAQTSLANLQRKSSQDIAQVEQKITNKQAEMQTNVGGLAQLVKDFSSGNTPAIPNKIEKPIGG